VVDPSGGVQSSETTGDHLAHGGEVVLAGQTPHGELPVVGLLRHRVLEHDHGAYGLLSLDRGDVEALDANRQALEVQALPQLLERLHPPQARALRLDSGRLERDPRVALRELQDAAFLAPDGRANPDPRAAELRQELRERLRVAGIGRDQDLGRDARGGAVVLEAEGFEDRLDVLAPHVLELEAVAVDQLAVAERKDLDGGALAVDRHADDVDAVRLPLVRGLALGEVTQGEQTVSVARRILEALLGGGDPHALLQLALDRSGLAGQELDDSRDDLSIVLGGDVADARRVTAVDVVVEARNPRVPAGLRPLARTELEDPIEDVEGLAHLLRVGVRSEVDDPAPMTLAGEHHARVLVVDRHRDVREGLVVAQTDVERRTMALDEALLHVQGFGLAARDDRLHVGDPLDELRHPEPGVAPALEVAPHPRAQRLRLPDVEHRSVFGPEEVHTRLPRESLQLCVECPVHRSLT
jgi:hypothetical protein